MTTPDYLQTTDFRLKQPTFSFGLEIREERRPTSIYRLFNRGSQASVNSWARIPKLSGGPQFGGLEVLATFGKAIGGGRRRVAREPLPVPAVVSRIERRQVATLVDFSSTGARLQGSNLPPVGEPVSLLIDCVRAYGTVAWAEKDLCGVAFDAPLARFEVDRLRRDAKYATLTFESVEEKLAAQDWMNGLAR